MNKKTNSKKPSIEEVYTDLKYLSAQVSEIDQRLKNQTEKISRNYHELKDESYTFRMYLDSELNEKKEKKRFTMSTNTARATLFYCAGLSLLLATIKYFIS